MILTTIIMITANITPYLAFGKATPRILLGLNSSLLFSSDIYDYEFKKGATTKQRPNFILNYQSVILLL